MPASLMARWMDYARIEPFGQPWENWLMAAPTSLYARVHAKPGAIVKMDDFIYKDQQSKEEEERQALEAFFARFEGNG